MTVQFRFRSVAWILPAAFALAPAAFFAQQATDNPEPAQTMQAKQTKTEEGQRVTNGAQAQAEKDDKIISGMSILGNQEAPKSLVIVPWKSSEIGESVGISTMLDDSRQPVDKEVFMRMLSYYDVRSAPAAGKNAEAVGKSAAVQPATTAHGRKK